MKKTLKDLDEMKNISRVPYRNKYEFLFATLEDYYISKMDGIDRIKAELGNWDIEAQKVIANKLINNISESGIIGFDKNEILSLIGWEPEIGNYYVINLEKVDIEKEHPYTLIFKGYIPTFGNNKLYTFKYDGEIVYTDASLSDDIKVDFANQLMEDYRCGIKFDIKKVRKKLETKNQYRMKMQNKI